MDSLMFSLNSTIPVFLVMVLGYVLNKMGFFSESFLNISDKLVFRVALPAMLFMDMSGIDLYSDFDLKYVAFCACATTVAFLSIWALAKLFIRDRKITGEFVQASYRSSAAILGAAYIVNIYGDTGMVPLMMIGSVPLFNVFAVIVLTLESPEKVTAAEAGARIKQAFFNILKNPIIDGIAVGLLASALRLKLPAIADKTLTSVASLTTPLALLAIGAGFEFSRMRTNIRLTAVVSAIKLVVLPAVFLPAAVYLGFTDQKLIALMIMLGACSTPTCFVMAKNMGHDGSLTSSAVVCTTLLSTVTLTFWIFLFRSMGYIL
ncbi:AEC family transporter [Lachnospiraceae bacterium NSJ-143]|nr:AEC family transporter [Lachnospiraceae bacterium NSJ-143]